MDTATEPSLKSDPRRRRASTGTSRHRRLIRPTCALLSGRASSPDCSSRDCRQSVQGRGSLGLSRWFELYRLLSMLTLRPGERTCAPAPGRRWRYRRSASFVGRVTTAGWSGPWRLRRRWRSGRQVTFRARRGGMVLRFHPRRAGWLLCRFSPMFSSFGLTSHCRRLRAGIRHASASGRFPDCLLVRRPSPPDLCSSSAAAIGRRAPSRGERQRRAPMSQPDHRTDHFRIVAEVPPGPRPASPQTSTVGSTAPGSHGTLGAGRVVVAPPKCQSARARRRFFRIPTGPSIRMSPGRPRRSARPERVDARWRELVPGCRRHADAPPHW